MIALLHEIEVRPEQDHGAEDRQDDSPRMEFPIGGLPDEASDHATYQRAADAQQRCHPETQANGAWIEETREYAHNEADQDHPDDAHDAHSFPPTCECGECRTAPRMMLARERCKRPCGRGD